MKTSAPFIPRNALLGLAFGLLLLGAATPASAQAWLASPSSGDWNTAGNWTPAAMPNSSSATAAFSQSNTTAVLLVGSATVNGIVFNPSASAYTITASPTDSLTISGTGVTNNSGITQNFVTDVSGAHIGGFEFTNSATAGVNTAFINPGGVVNGGDGGDILFINTSTAGNGAFTNGGGTVNGALGGSTTFGNSSTAASGTFTNNGGTISGALGGSTTFNTTANAANGILIANGGSNGGGGGGIYFSGSANGGTASVTANGNGFLDISGLTATGMNIGSIAGSGSFDLGSKTLTVGGNNIGTVVSGVIQNGGKSGGSGGAIIKTGTGTLTLSGANTYTGSTTVNEGVLEFAKEGSLYGNNTANWNTTRIVVNSGATLALNVGGSGEFTSTDVGALSALGTNTGGFKSGALLGLDTTNAGGNFTYSETIANTNNGANAIGLNKLGTGTLTLSATNTYTGATLVSQGGLIVNGSIVSSSGITVSAGASLGGHGNVGALSGGGTVAPGDPQIMTAASVDLSGSMSFTFQLTQTGSPTYINSGTSGNDVLRLTSGSPLPGGPLSAINTVDVDFTGDSLADGQLYLGGFYTDAGLNTAQVGTPNFNYIGASGSYAVQYEGMVADTANFGAGPVDGTVMEFEVVPEPSTYAMLAIGGAALLITLRRRKWPVKRENSY